MSTEMRELKRPLTVYITTEQREHLRRCAKYAGIAMTEMVRWWLDHQLTTGDGWKCDRLETGKAISVLEARTGGRSER